MLAANIKREDKETTPTQESVLAQRGIWLVNLLPRPTAETERVAYETDKTPAGYMWNLRHDFIFAKVGLTSNIYFIPKAELMAPNKTLALIGYASLLDVDALNNKYSDAISTYALRKVFSAFERKFISPGNSLQSTPQLTEHNANAEASTSGAVVVELDDQSLVEPFSFAGIRKLSTSIALTLFTFRFGN